MSVSLESLMREVEAQRGEVPRGLEFSIFVLVAVASVLGFVLLSDFLVGLPSGLPPWMVGLASYVVCLMPAYFVHRRYAFRSRAPHRTAVPAYLAIQSSGLVFAVLFSYAAYGVFALPTVSAALLVIVLTSGFNFLLLRALVFWRWM